MASKKVESSRYVYLSDLSVAIIQMKEDLGLHRHVHRSTNMSGLKVVCCPSSLFLCCYLSAQRKTFHLMDGEASKTMWQ